MLPSFGDICGQLSENSILQDGEPVGLLSPLTDPDEVERFKMAYSTQLQAILARGRQEIAEGKGMNHDEFWANLDDEEES